MRVLLNPPKPLDHSSIDALLGSLRSDVYYQFRADNLAIASPIWKYWHHDIPSLPRDAVRLTMWHHGYGRFMCDCDYTHMFSVVYRLGGIGLRPTGECSGVRAVLSQWLESVTGLIHIIERQPGARVRFDGGEDISVDDSQRSQLDKNLEGVFSDTQPRSLQWPLTLDL